MRATAVSIDGTNVTDGAGADGAGADGAGADGTGGTGVDPSWNKTASGA